MRARLISGAVTPILGKVSAAPVIPPLLKFCAVGDGGTIRNVALNSDFSLSETGSFQPSGIGGLTLSTVANANFYYDCFVVSPDGKWAVIGNANASPVLQMYRRTGPKTWNYYGPMPSAPASVNYVNHPTYGSMNKGTLAFSANSLEFSCGQGTNFKGRVFWTLSGETWSFAGTKPGFSGNSAYTTVSNALSLDYQESTDGTYKIELADSGGNFYCFYSTNGAAPSLVYMGQGLSNCYGVSFALSPLKTSILMHAGRTSQGSQQASRSLNSNGVFSSGGQASVTGVFQGANGTPNAASGMFPGPICWLTETLAVLTGFAVGYSPPAVALSLVTCPANSETITSTAGLTLTSTFSSPGSGGAYVITEVRRLSDTEFLIVIANKEVYRIGVVGGNSLVVLSSCRIPYPLVYSTKIDPAP